MTDLAPHDVDVLAMPIETQTDSDSADFVPSEAIPSFHFILNRQERTKALGHFRFTLTVSGTRVTRRSACLRRPDRANALAAFVRADMTTRHCH